MMNKAEVFEALVSIINNSEVNTSDDDITMDSLLTNVCGDSIDMFEVMFTVEDSFDINVENAHSLVTVGDLVNYIVDEEKCKCN